MSEKNVTMRFIVAFAVFMEAVDATILNTAIPPMSTSLHVSPINLKVALISYLLMLAIFVPISGWAVDKWGTKKIFLSALCLFTFSSFACGFSTSLWELIIMRCFQGIGGSFMLPVARLIIIRSVPRNQIVQVMGNVMMLGALGMVCGPVLGGLITEYWTWPWIFFINVPIGIIAIIITYYNLNETQKVAVPKLDKIGFFLFGIGLALFTFGLSAFGLSALSEREFPIRFSGYCIVISLVFLSLYFFHARRRKHSIVNVELFKSYYFRISVFGNLVTRIGFGGMPFLIPLLLQINFNYSPAQSGLLLMPIAFGVIISKLFTAKLLKYLKYRRYLIINTILVGLLVMSFALITHNTSWIVIVIVTFLYGILTAQQYAGMNSLGYQEVSEQQLSSATSFMGTLQPLSQTFGVAVAAILLYVGLFFMKSNALTPEIFKIAFIALGVITLLSLPIFWRLRGSADLKV